MDAHIWEGPMSGVSIACGCSVKKFTISKITDFYAEGIITVVDHIEGGIVFTEPWEAIMGAEGWEVKRREDETASWKNKKTGEIHSTLNDEVNASIKVFVSEKIVFFLETGQKKVGLVKMTEDDRVKALQEKKLFKVEGSFIFAVQVPDDSVGCSGSRCSNCGNKTAYCIQRCMWCGFPFVGPFGVPQILKWNLFTDEDKKDVAINIYNECNKGRLGYINVEAVPLIEEELRAIEALDEYFASTHSISVQEIRSTLFE